MTPRVTTTCEGEMPHRRRPISRRALVPDLGVNYPDWEMGTSDLGNGLLSSISVLTTSHFIEH